MFEVIDSLKRNEVVASFPTHRRAMNYSNKLEPKPSVPSEKFGPSARREWRYLVRKALPVKGA